MTVYFALPKVDNGSVKIGVTTNIAKRTIALSGGIPGGVVMVATIAGGADVESFLHDKFASHRLNGEWFAHCDEIKDFIRDVQNGRPGLIPFENVEQGRSKSVTEFAADAVAQAREMATALLKEEFRGPGDTIESAMDRIERRTDLSIHMFRSLRHRVKHDIWAGEYLALKFHYDALMMRRQH